MSNSITTYILFSNREVKRVTQVNLLQSYFPASIIIEPIFPEFQKVPFLNKIIQASKNKTGNALLTNEVGVFMSHRKIWEEIAKQPTVDKHYLVLESDSLIQNINIIEDQFSAIENQYDLFFWGAWNNHVSIKRSTRSYLDKNYYIGTPLIRSVYGAYGYSLNAKTATYLLSVTKKLLYPVDLYKHYIDTSKIRIGAIRPEVIGTWQTTDSTIRKETNFDKIKRILIIKIFNTRNQILAYFC